MTARRRLYARMALSVTLLALLPLARIAVQQARQAKDDAPMVARESEGAE